MVVILIGFILVFGLSSSTGGSTGGSSSGGGSNHKETVVYQPPPQQQQPQVIVVGSPPNAPQQQPAVQPAPSEQQKQQGRQASSVKNFAVKSYDKIAKDSQKGSGEYLNSLILLMESEGVPKDEALPLIKKPRFRRGARIFAASRFPAALPAMEHDRICGGNRRCE